MVLGVLAEHSLPFTMAPVLVELAQTLALDKVALNSMKLSRTAATYKMVHGLGRTFSERTFSNLRKYPFSLNLDESTSNNNKKVGLLYISLFTYNLTYCISDYILSVHVGKLTIHFFYIWFEGPLNSGELLSSRIEKGHCGASGVAGTSQRECHHLGDFPVWLFQEEQPAVETSSQHADGLLCCYEGKQVWPRDEGEEVLSKPDGDSCHHMHNRALWAVPGAAFQGHSVVSRSGTNYNNHLTEHAGKFECRSLWSNLNALKYLYINLNYIKVFIY